MTAPARSRELAHFVARLRRPGFSRSVLRTAGFNVGSTAAAALGGLVIARALGPSVRGDYAAVTAWFGVALTVGALGQPAALCFYVARDPSQARDYVATSRTMMVTTGALSMVAGLLLASVLAHGHPDLEDGYRIAFSSCIVAFVAASFTFSLQGRSIRLWNIVRVSQPTLGCLVILGLWAVGLLSLRMALVALPVSVTGQLVWSYWQCRRAGLVPGRTRAALVRPLAWYGVTQIAAVTPTLLNTQLDQLVLSQTVPAADLGRYAIAVSLTLLPTPIVAAIGNVAFPRLASRTDTLDEARRLQRAAIRGSAVLAVMVLAPLALSAPWLVPFVFGAGYRGAIPLLWILSPGGVFLACGRVVGDLLRGRNRPIVVAWAQGLAAVLTIGILIVLLPIVGVYAAAIASTASYATALAVMLRSLKRLPESVSDRFPATPASPPEQ